MTGNEYGVSVPTVAERDGVTGSWRWQVSDKMGCLLPTEGYWARKPMHGDPKRVGAFIFDSRDNSVCLTVFS